MRKRALVALSAGAALLFLFYAWRHHARLVDDAYITLRYARNILEGHGPVYNPGERVEGYTSPLFLALGTVFLALGVDPIVAWKVVLFTAALGTLWGVARLERRWEAVPELAVPLAPLLLLTLPGFAYWAVGTMEAMLFAALVVWSTELTLRGREAGRGLYMAALVFALAALTRPEGMAFFAVAMAAVLVPGIVRRDRLVPLRRGAVAAAVFTVPVAAHLAWRLAYYGQWRPNTYEAKVTGDWPQLRAAIGYASRFLADHPLLVAAALVPVVWLVRPGRAGMAGSLRPLATVTPLAAVAVAIVLALGGDSMPFHRFFVPALPFLAVLAAWGLRLLLERLRPGVRAPVLVTVLLLHAGAAAATRQGFVAFFADRSTRVGEAVGRWLDTWLEEEDTIAVNTAGSVPYHARRRAIDMLGLTDPWIAHRPVWVVSEGFIGHRRGWGEYVLRRRPRVIFFYNMAGDDEPFYLGDRELADMPGFRFFYRLRRVELPPLERERRVPFERLAGAPFGRRPARILDPGLGLEARFRTFPVPHTELYPTPIQVRFFERERRYEALWDELGLPSREDVPAFVEAVAERWSRSAPGPGDGEARARVEAACERAESAVRAGELEAAKALLTSASAEAAAARAPCLYRDIANLAVLERDLHAALAAQKELLRLEPRNILAQRNLARLLVVPRAEFSEDGGTDAP